MTDPRAYAAVGSAAADDSPVEGRTHKLYRYPARFSPVLASEVIEHFSEVGDTVWDPFSGGGTTAVEAIAAGRRVVGTDINTLATFVARLKTLRLSNQERTAVLEWANEVVPALRATQRFDTGALLAEARTIRNLSTPETWPIRDFLAVALDSIPDQPDEVNFLARGAILGTAQWALDGRRRPPNLSEFRNKLRDTVHSMIEGLSVLWENALAHSSTPSAVIKTADVIDVAGDPSLQDMKADLVLTSPPYPGVHVLYHRWQVQGGRETPAPYWITASQDGHGESYYTMGPRLRHAEQEYFDRMLPRMSTIRGHMKSGALMVQVLGFSDHDAQLPRYLSMLEDAGFEEARPPGHSRLWREVPGRRWYAANREASPGSREVVLIHQAS